LRSQPHQRLRLDQCPEASIFVEGDPKDRFMGRALKCQLQLEVHGTSFGILAELVIWQLLTHAIGVNHRLPDPMAYANRNHPHRTGLALWAVDGWTRPPAKEEPGGEELALLAGRLH
jgi:hypothetical protein